jgi:hypothetical protein
LPKAVQWFRENWAEINAAATFEPGVSSAVRDFTITDGEDLNISSVYDSELVPTSGNGNVIGAGIKHGTPALGGEGPDYPNYDTSIQKKSS